VGAHKTSNRVGRLQVNVRNTRFLSKHPLPPDVNSGETKRRKLMKRYGLLILAVGGIAALGAGCVERQVVYVPAQPGAPTGPVVAEQAPPPPQAEVVPAVPGPDYVWLPGYWSIGVGGAWVWIGGHYALPPRP